MQQMDRFLVPKNQRLSGGIASKFKDNKFKTRCDAANANQLSLDRSLRTDLMRSSTAGNFSKKILHN
jgi:hypothetical protein